jgi:hypothetical protein
VGTERDRQPGLVLVASPLLGPAVWEPVARVLESRGWSVTLPPPYAGVRTPADVLAQLLAAIPAAEPIVLVTHSNAGLYAAAIAAQRDVRGIVFTDALLPQDRPTESLREPAFRAFLAGLADREGRLPGWTRWWPAEEVSRLFPDRASRDAVEREQARLPLAYFDEEVPAPPGWRRLPAAYLGFGDTYAEEQAVAAAEGWPVERLDGRHLHPLVDPDGVAAALEGLVGRMGLDRP